ncbi:hypothetical protein [Neogemmobacter tilapiae]|uniref:DUF4350 domain-containing protein n=1 Tax=Neogemmobacter tilapiae TaxID=875041 RepID=A0A918TFJ3_9RHOB|nr:hypothetical protein [Gemmobacter tilapiae]GHC46969.1 hypothetical protein GCM10007315_05970 [Gemmobacter tilapiae]
MSEKEGAPTAPKIEYLVVGVVVLMALAAAFYLSSQRQQALRYSRLGLEGMVSLLAAGETRAQSYFGDWPINQDEIGLLLVPLYDTRLDQTRTFPVTDEQHLMQSDEYDLELNPILAKAAALPTMVVLPKWRSGVRLTGLAHPVLLVDSRAVEQTLRRLTGQRGGLLQRSGQAFTDHSYMAIDGSQMLARLYVAQTFDGAGCEPVVGQLGRMVLGECPVAGRADKVLILADPDLLNNHGLRLGQNAGILRDLVAARAQGKDVVIDYSPEDWLSTRQNTPKRERSWSDLARFLEPPFLAMWLGGAMTLLLFLWRGGLRLGPVPRISAGAGASKMQAIGARARLMRRTGQDGPLLAEYAAARIAATAARLVGPAHARLIGEEQGFLRYVARHHAGKVDRLNVILTTLRNLPLRISAAEAIQHVDELEQVLEQITHDT